MPNGILKYQADKEIKIRQTSGTPYHEWVRSLNEITTQFYFF